MISGRCCEVTAAGPGGEPSAARTTKIAERPPTVRRSFRGLAGWLVPGAVLALMPKCPACLAAYVALGTGLALSASAAAYLRMTLVVLCIASLSYLGTRRLWRQGVAFFAYIHDKL